MTASTTTNRVLSYFFLFDFHHNKGTSDELDLLAESVIYFYPNKEDIKKQKLLDLGEIVGLIQCLKYDLFSAVPSEFNYKKSLVTCEHYGRHSAFLVLSKDRFTTDEANLHLTHILQLFNMLYGTLNHIQSVYPEIQQLHTYLKQTLTPIVEHIFTANRSLRNLFSAVDYAPLKKNTQRCLLHVKHFLNHLQATYGVKNGFFAFEKRILYSTFDSDTTYYIQVILSLGRHLSENETFIPLKSEIKLRNGVSLLRIYIRRPPSLQRILNAVNANTEPYSNVQIKSEPIKITPSVFSNETHFKGYSAPLKSHRFRSPIIQEDPAGSSEETTGFATDRTEDTSPLSTGTNSITSPANDKRSNPLYSKDETIITNSHNSKDEALATNSHNSKEESLTDFQKTIYQYVRSRTGTMNTGFEESIKAEQDSFDSKDRLDYAIVKTIDYDDDDDLDSCGDCCPENAIFIPRQSILTSFHRTRRRTITNYPDANDAEFNTSNDNPDGNAKWGDVPETNDEMERDELVLYIQQNSRMIFTGIIEKHLLSEEYLQKLWSLVLIGMADMDRDIQVNPLAGETSKHNINVKFQFNDNTHQVQYDQPLDVRNNYYKTLSSEGAMLAFSARTILNKNPERKMIGLSRGSHLISINRYLPDRVTYFCRRLQEPR